MRKMFWIPFLVGCLWSLIGLTDEANKELKQRIRRQRE